MEWNSSKLESLLETDSRRILIVFLMIAVLTLGLSFAGGPDPKVKIYILASQKTADSLSMLIREKVSDEIIFFTPQVEFNDLDVLIRTRTIKTILIADFPFIFRDIILFQDFLETTIVPAERVVIVRSFENYTLASKIIAHGLDNTRIMSELEICDEIRSMMKDIERSYPRYSFFMKSTAFSSLALVGAGAAFYSSRILESGSKNTMRGLIEGILIAGSVFIFIQGIYIISSTILETPISLHTTTAKITAMSSIGPFGGGTVPRILFTSLGLVVGILSVSKKADVKISLTTITITVLALTLLIAEGINIFGERNLLGMLLLKYAHLYYKLTYQHVSYELYRTSSLLLSRGIMLIFPGLLPIGVVPRMKSKFQTPVISFSIVVGSWGMMRVGDMRPSVALNSFLPGIVLGILLSVLIVSVDKAIVQVVNIILKVIDRIGKVLQLSGSRSTK